MSALLGWCLYVVATAIALGVPPLLLWWRRKQTGVVQ